MRLGHRRLSTIGLRGSPTVATEETVASFSTADGIGTTLVAESHSLSSLSVKDLFNDQLMPMNTKGFLKMFSS